MACVIVPAAEAVAVCAFAIACKKHEVKFNSKIEDESKKKNFSSKLFKLSYLLGGGSLLLAFEHIWHGEIVPFFPFLTAVSEGSDAIQVMLHEMATAGVGMAVLCTSIWAIGLLVSRLVSKKNKKIVLVKK